ncbi:MAG: ATP-dependent Clp protease ATP-binding subunit [Treponema sp.]|nr:ATP-dependent Clp protease ATP-binding subunit [Treponema sp.]
MKSFSPRAQRLIVALAQDEGRKSGASQLLPEHLMLALVKNADGLGYAILNILRVNVLTFQLELEKSISGGTVHAGDFSELPPSRRLLTLFESAEYEARSMRNNYIGTEHLLLAAIRENASVTCRYFERSGISFETAREAAFEARERVQTSAGSSAKGGDADFKRMMGQERNSYDRQVAGVGSEQRGKKEGFLKNYSRDITEIALKGLADPVVGRKTEIDRVVQILSRRTKNNPLLIGEPGVGKTAIVEGLAERIATANVPYNLMKKRVLTLDLTALIAGTKYRGEFEERMKRLMKEVRDDKNVILFIDEIHTIIGAGGPEGSLDASNILKPALSRGEIQIVGATTIREYRRYMEKDAALARRFQTVSVDEPTDQESEQILMGLKPKYEEFHNVKYTDQVIPSIIKFSRRYLTDRFLPDKAIDILDEAGAQKKIAEGNRPAELDELERRIDLLGQEKNALVKSQNYERAAEVRDKVLELKERLEAFKTEWKSKNGAFVKEVGVKDICSIISQMTGIPAEQLSDDEKSRLLKMESELHKSVIGQDEAIKAIASAVRRSRSGISSPKRPTGSFIFLGPTGVGKTQLAKSLAKFLFGTEDALIRLDMSDYMEKHNVSKMVGSPPGYVGFESGGQLTEQVRTHPYSVVLFDEIEKAHPEVFNLLLQILEEGELVDSLGHKINFRNSIIIMTSNAGAREITQEGRVGFSNVAGGVIPYEEIKSNAMQSIKEFMRPELLNRIDDILVFDALSREQVSRILDLQIAELNGRLAENSVTLKIKDAARDYLIEKGFDPSRGARPMRRLIQKEIEDPLSLLMLEGKVSDCAIVDCVDGSLVVQAKKSRTSKKSKKEKSLEPSF